MDFLQPFNLKKINKIVKIDDIISFSSYLESEYYHSFMKENRLLDEMGIYLQYNNKLVGVIGLLRARDEKQFTETDSVKLHFLIKHIENGFNIQRLINGRENENNLNLTAREQELVTYLEKGIKNKEIANILY
ncbi:hypothetical protein, partial [Ligilactobacillus salivarius]|uniref:hypothetical protein n=1 Tax=Ligilactobacillus salivarius TaxID=1624 RepID=UPI0023B0320F